jgi:hypothetical protein
MNHEENLFFSFKNYIFSMGKKDKKKDPAKALLKKAQKAQKQDQKKQKTEKKKVTL